MKRELNYLALSIVGLGLLFSCKKEKTTPVEDPTPTPTTPAFSNANAQALFNNLATPLQTYTINATSYNTYTCTNGTRIIIYPNAFLTQAGGAVSGVVNIEVKDILSKKDMILNNAIPVSNGQLLVSGGEVYFNATQGNQQLKINPATGVYFTVPAGNTPSTQMKEFYANAPSNLSNTNLNWVTPTTASTNITAFQDTAATGPNGPYYSYFFTCDSMSWSNCDYFYTIPGTKTTCTVNTTGSFNNSNTAVFLSLNGVTTLAHLNSTSYTSLSNSFASYQNSIPVGSIYTVIAIGFDGTNYHYASQVVTMTSNMVINMPALTQTTLSQIKTNLAGLP